MKVIFRRIADYIRECDKLLYILCFVTTIYGSNIFCHGQQLKAVYNADRSYGFGHRGCYNNKQF